MRHPEVIDSDQIARHQHFTLLELLDRLLDKGVMAKGEIVLSVADIDLVYLNLGVLLSSVKTVERAARRTRPGVRQVLFPSTPVEVQDEQPPPGPVPAYELERETTTLSSALEHGLERFLQPRTPIDPAEVEKGLVRLILTLVDLLRKLMEQQALRRIEAGQLDPDQIERVGTAFFLLDEKIEQIKETFGLKDEDLTIDLGPLGNLS